MARSTSQVKNRQQKFLDAIAQGHTILEAASSVGVSRSTIYNWREADPAFAKAWEFAYRTALMCMRKSHRIEQSMAA